MTDLFPNTRPYNDSEIPAAVARVASNPFFDTIVKYLFPDTSVEKFRQEFVQITTIDEFQEKVMLKAIGNIIQRTCTDFTEEGTGLLTPDRRYTFIANHRDILLDAALLQIVLKQNHLRTSEITFGSNLMQGDIVIDIGKMNKMFRIERGGTVHSFYKSSMEVSSYMRYALTEKGESTWIAQRNGRTKDGYDRTENAVLKMLSISSQKPFQENLAEMNITPVAISYEYEPCDFLKTQELYISQYQKYIKEPGEDLRSILKGVTQEKGHVHIAITPPVTAKELADCDNYEKNLKFERLAQIIDQRITDHYKLWKTNHIAYDLLHQSQRFADQYTSADADAFVRYMESGLQGLSGERDELRNIFLKIYANPITNKMDNASSTTTEWKTNNL
jgi:hypothetical protein